MASSSDKMITSAFVLKSPMADEDLHPHPFHLLVFPFPAQGHLIPLLDLAHHLSLRLRLRHRPHLITVVVTPANLHLLHHFLSSTPSAAPLVLPLTLDDQSPTSLPAGVEHVRDLPPTVSIAALMRAIYSLRPNIRSWAQSHPNPPVALLSDFFLGWTHHLAADLGIPRVAFYPSGAFLVAALDHLLIQMPPLPPDGSAALVTLDPLPSSPSFPYPHLPSVIRRYKAGDLNQEFSRDAFLANSASWGAAINTFDALESEYLAHLKQSYGHGRVWAIGPLSPTGPPAGRGGRSSVQAEELTAWLDSCPPRSVVYICFGSQYTMTETQGRTIAAALEISGIRFLWAVGNGASTVPEGFEQKAAGRGMIVPGWVPQVAILRNCAVGSFLTHCGWNSLLEAVSAGVALLAWPMEADQFINARLLVESARVAAWVGEGDGAGVPASDELAKALEESVAEEGRCPEMRLRGTELGRRSAEAVTEGGSSYRDMEELVKELAKLG